MKMAQPRVSKATRFLVAIGIHPQLGIDKEQGHRCEICMELVDLPKNFPQLPRYRRSLFTGIKANEAEL